MNKSNQSKKIKKTSKRKNRNNRKTRRSDKRKNKNSLFQLKQSYIGGQGNRITNLDIFDSLFDDSEIEYCRLYAIELYFILFRIKQNNNQLNTDFVNEYVINQNLKTTFRYDILFKSRTENDKKNKKINTNIMFDIIKSEFNISESEQNNIRLEASQKVSKLRDTAAEESKGEDDGAYQYKIGDTVLYKDPMDSTHKKVVIKNVFKDGYYHVYFPSNEQIYKIPGDRLLDSATPPQENENNTLREELMTKKWAEWRIKDLLDYKYINYDHNLIGRRKTNKVNNIIKRKLLTMKNLNNYENVVEPEQRKKSKSKLRPRRGGGGNYIEQIEQIEQIKQIEHIKSTINNYLIKYFNNIKPDDNESIFNFIKKFTKIYYTFLMFDAGYDDDDIEVLSIDVHPLIQHSNNKIFNEPGNYIAKNCYSHNNQYCIQNLNLNEAKNDIYVYYKNDGTSFEGINEIPEDVKYECRKKYGTNFEIINFKKINQYENDQNDQIMEFLDYGYKKCGYIKHKDYLNNKIFNNSDYKYITKLVFMLGIRYSLDHYQDKNPIPKPHHNINHIIFNSVLLFHFITFYKLQPEKLKPNISFKIYKNSIDDPFKCLVHDIIHKYFIIDYNNKSNYKLQPNILNIYGCPIYFMGHNYVDLKKIIMTKVIVKYLSNANEIYNILDNSQLFKTNYTNYYFNRIISQTKRTPQNPVLIYYKDFFIRNIEEGLKVRNIETKFPLPSQLIDVMQYIVLQIDKDSRRNTLNFDDYRLQEVHENAIQHGGMIRAVSSAYRWFRGKQADQSAENSEEEINSQPDNTDTILNKFETIESKNLYIIVDLKNDINNSYSKEYNEKQYKLFGKSFYNTLSTTLSTTTTSVLETCVVSGGKKNKKLHFQKGGDDLDFDSEGFIRLLQYSAESIDNSDFNIDSAHDKLYPWGENGKKEILKSGDHEDNAIMRNSIWKKINTQSKLVVIGDGKENGDEYSLNNNFNDNYNQMFKNEIFDELKTENPNINLILDAGASAFKLLRHNQIASYIDPTIVAKICPPNDGNNTSTLSNKIDPAGVGSGNLYTCIKKIQDKLPPSINIDGNIFNINKKLDNNSIVIANLFLKYCIIFISNIKGNEKGSKLGEIYQNEFRILDQFQIIDVKGKDVQCIWKSPGSESIKFKWEGNQTTMANYIAKYGGYSDARNKKKTSKNKLLDYFDKKNKDLGLIVCRLLKYIGDKSHIVCALFLYKILNKAQIILTIDRLLYKTCVQVIDSLSQAKSIPNLLYDDDVAEYKQISQNFGVILGKNDNQILGLMKNINNYKKFLDELKTENPKKYTYLTYYFNTSEFAQYIYWRNNLKKILDYNEGNNSLPEFNNEISTQNNYNDANNYLSGQSNDNVTIIDNVNLIKNNKYIQNAYIRKIVDLENEQHKKELESFMKLYIEFINGQQLSPLDDNPASNRKRRKLQIKTNLKLYKINAKYNLEFNNFNTFINTFYNKYKDIMIHKIKGNTINNKIKNKIKDIINHIRHKCDQFVKRILALNPLLYNEETGESLDTDLFNTMDNIITIETMVLEEGTQRKLNNNFEKNKNELVSIFNTCNKIINDLNKEFKDDPHLNENDLNDQIIRIIKKRSKDTQEVYNYENVSNNENVYKYVYGYDLYYDKYQNKDLNEIFNNFKIFTDSKDEATRKRILTDGGFIIDTNSSPSANQNIEVSSPTASLPADMETSSPLVSSSADSPLVNQNIEISSQASSLSQFSNLDFVMDDKDIMSDQEINNLIAEIFSEEFSEEKLLPDISDMEIDYE